jgi:hypothetical protein
MVKGHLDGTEICNIDADQGLLYGIDFYVETSKYTGGYTSMLMTTKGSLNITKNVTIVINAGKILLSSSTVRLLQITISIRTWLTNTKPGIFHPMF